MFMENLFSQSAYFFEFLLGGSHVARGMFRDPKIVLGLMGFYQPTTAGRRSGRQSPLSQK
jgi:hypothetical protein